MNVLGCYFGIANRSWMPKRKRQRNDMEFCNFSVEILSLIDLLQIFRQQQTFSANNISWLKPVQEVYTSAYIDVTKFKILIIETDLNIEFLKD